MSAIYVIIGVVFVAYIIIIFSITYGTLRRDKTVQCEPKTSTKSISIIIPCRNEEQNIGILLQLLGENTLIGNDEIIIVDDSSEDETVKIVKSFKKQRIRQLSLQEMRPGLFGKKQALLLGLAEASGELILLTDADCRPGPEWVSKMRKCYSDERNSTVMLLAPVLPKGSNSLLHHIELLEFSVLMCVTRGSTAIGNPVLANSSNVMIRRDAFQSSNAYEGNQEISSGDDMFLLEKIRREYGCSGIRFNNDPASIVYTSAVKNLRQWVSQRLRWASKSRGYRDPSIMIVAGTVFIVNAMLLLFIAGAFLYRTFSELLVLALILKIFIDLPLVATAIGRYGRKVLWLLYVPAQIGGIFYVSLTGIFGQFARPVWKGRKLNS